MIGVFDSGVGGICAFSELRRLLPMEDIIYLADRKNAPYGTKTKDEIISLTRANIKRLVAMGSERVLIACCTASTIHGELSGAEREVSLPIIAPAARLAAHRGRRIAVIATEHTVSSHAFSREIGKISDCPIYEFAEQNLVRLVEGGCRDGRVSDECAHELSRISSAVRRVRADTLILGCTHFSHLEGELSRRLFGVRIISPAREGARELVKTLKTDRSRERGRTVYT